MQRAGREGGQAFEADEEVFVAEFRAGRVL
jgi:hypothetical protein